jgi:hypothetical protein
MDVYMTRNLLSRSIIVTALLVAGLGPIEAAEKIRWEDLQRRLAAHRIVRVWWSSEVLTESREMAGNTTRVDY